MSFRLHTKKHKMLRMNRQPPQHTRHSAPLTYATGTLPAGEFSVFLISSADSPVHISFSRKTHEQACRWLRRHGGELLPLTPRQKRSFSRLFAQLLAGRQRTAQLPDSPFVRKATPFQRQVWDLLLGIPHGETRTYGELARTLGNAGLARAVGRACGANPLPLLVPCHRVVGASGPGGFTGGLHIKHSLLAREQGLARKTRPCR